MKNKDKAYDLFILGPVYTALYGEQRGSALKELLSFKKSLGGMAAVALGCARLDLRTAICAQVGQDEMGQFIADSLSQAKVDISQLYDGACSTGLVLKALDDQNQITTALSYQSLQMPWPKKEGLELIAQSRALWITSHLLAGDTDDHLKKVIATAKKNGTKIILLLEACLSHVDLAQLKIVLSSCDVVIGFEAAFGLITKSTQVETVLQKMREHTQAVLILHAPLKAYVSLAKEPSSLNKLGKGALVVDAFNIGFLKGWLKGQAPLACSHLADACQKLTQHRSLSDSFPSAKVLDYYLSQEEPMSEAALCSAYFEHMHYTTTRYFTPCPQFIFDFGDREQWLKLSRAYTTDETMGQLLIKLVAQGLYMAMQDEISLQIMSDDDLPQEVTDLFSRFIYTMNVPGKVPLQFKGDPDITRTLIGWPVSHCVKAAVTYHPDDRYVLRGQQEAALGFLYRACRAAQHELLIEITPPTNSLITAGTIAHVMRRFYEIGIYPDCWQIAPPRDQRSWDSITRIVVENDLHCRGIWIGGQSISVKQLPLLFEATARQKYCQGFVVNRSLFQPQIEQWLTHKATKEELIHAIARDVNKVFNLWVKARSQVKHNVAT